MKQITVTDDNERTLHPSVNGEAILKIADVIETGRLAVEEGVGFNMVMFFSSMDDVYPYIVFDHTGHECGTTACVAGITVAVFDGVSEAAYLARKSLRDVYPYEDTIVTRAARHLGLDEAQAAVLFGNGNPAITTACAAAVMRHLAYTGEVDWSVTG